MLSTDSRPISNNTKKSLLIKFLSRTDKINLFTYLNFFSLKFIFLLTKISFLNKIINKFYSYKFYDEFYLNKKLIFKGKNK